jgi:hypothetical protein
MKQSTFTPKFVETVPEELEEGCLYISIRFRTASHLCACGCGGRVVTPIKPPKWKFTYDGENVWLFPSIGRWKLPCRSHYVIREGKVVWARSYTDREIEAVARRDAHDLHAYYAGDQDQDDSELETKESAGLLSRLWGRFRS